MEGRYVSRALLCFGVLCFSDKVSRSHPSLELTNDGGPCASDPPVCTSQALGLVGDYIRLSQFLKLSYSFQNIIF